MAEYTIIPKKTSVKEKGAILDIESIIYGSRTPMPAIIKKIGIQINEVSKINKVFLNNDTEPLPRLGRIVADQCGTAINKIDDLLDSLGDAEKLVAKNFKSQNESCRIFAIISAQKEVLNSLLEVASNCYSRYPPENGDKTMRDLITILEVWGSRELEIFILFQGIFRKNF